MAVPPGVVRVFLSSTFRDMGPEREALMKRAFPRLRQFCRAKGLVAAEIDLRWGIQEQTEIVSTCFQEIERCNFFIGIVGNAYGTRLRELSQQYAPPESFWNLYPWVRDRQESSITELEIEHGVLGDEPRCPHARFYFRKSAGTNPFARGDDDARLAALKDRIRGCGSPYQDGYNSPSELADWLAADLLSDLQAVYPAEKKSSLPAQVQVAHEQFAQAFSRTFVGRQEDFRRLDQSIRQGSKPLLVCGPPGIGKTALIARWIAQHCRQGICHVSPAASWWQRWGSAGAAKEFPCVAHFAGVEGETERLTTLLRSLSLRLDALRGAEQRDDEDPLSLRHRFARRLQEVAKIQPLLLVIDGLDHVDERDLVMGLPWLPAKLPEGVRLIVTASRDSISRAWRERCWNVLELAELTREELQQYVADDLNRLYGRKLLAKEEGQLLDARLFRQPRMARSVLEELRHVGSYSEVESRVTSLTKLDDQEALLQSILARWQIDYDISHHGGPRNFVLLALSLLSLARVGLTEVEWRKAIGTPDNPLPCAHLSPLIHALDLWLHDRGGILALSSQEFRSALNGCRQRNGTNGNETTDRALQHRLIAVFESEGDAIRQADELLWHLTAVGDWPKLACELSNLSFLAQIWPTHGQLIPLYWDRLENQTGLKRWEVFQPYAELPPQDFAQLKALYFSVERHAPDAVVLNLAQQLFAAAQQTGREAICDALLIQASACLQRSGLDAAQQLLEGAIQLSANLPRSQAACFANLGIIAFRQRAFLLAEQQWQQALQLSEKLGDVAGVSDVRANLAILAAEMGDLKKAVRISIELKQIYLQAGDQQRYLQWLGNHGLLLGKQQAVDEALEFHAEESELAEKLREDAVLSDSLKSRIDLLLQHDRYQDALLLAQQRLALGDRIGVRQQIDCKLQLAKILKELGEVGRSEELHHEATVLDQSLIR